MNYSDRWLAWKADTREGGTPQNTAETLRKFGVPLQEKWDFNSDVNSFEEFYKNPPLELSIEATKDFKDNYDFLHEYVPTDIENLKQALKLSPLGIGTPAWFINEKGLYYRPEGMQDNHFTTLIGYKDKEYWIIFDTYEQNIKHLDWNINPSVAKRFHIQKKEPTFYPEKRSNWVIDLFKSFSSFFKAVFKKWKQIQEKIKYI